MNGSLSIRYLIMASYGMKHVAVIAIFNNKNLCFITIYL
jgi:hypothetical protein